MAIHGTGHAKIKKLSYLGVGILGAIAASFPAALAPGPPTIQVSRAVSAFMGLACIVALAAAGPSDPSDPGLWAPLLGLHASLLLPLAWNSAQTIRAKNVYNALAVVLGSTHVRCQVVVQDANT